MIFNILVFLITTKSNTTLKNVIIFTNIEQDRKKTVKKIQSIWSQFCGISRKYEYHFYISLDAEKTQSICLGLVLL